MVLGGSQAYAADQQEYADRIIVDTDSQTIKGTYENRYYDSSADNWWDEWSTQGGVIKNTAQDLTIEDAVFDNNSLYTNSEGEWMSAQGGVLNNTEGAVITEIKNTTFSNNTATGVAANSTAFGGALYNSGEINSINTVTFNGNEVAVTYSNGMPWWDIQGGALYNASSGIIGEIFNSTFENNIANQGGAIYNAGTITLIKDTTFNNNTVSYNADSIMNDGGTIGTIDNITIKAQKGYDNGAGSISAQIFSSGGTIGTIKNSTFTDNSGSTMILIQSGASIDEISNTKFNNNNLAYGVIRVHQSSLGNISNSEFNSNTLSSAGGVVQVVESDMGSITNSSFENNSSTPLYFWSTNDIRKTGDITNSTFNNNTGRESAAIYAYGMSIGDIINCEFKNNKGSNGVITLYSTYGYYDSDGWHDVQNMASLGNLENVLFEGNILSGRGILTTNNSNTIGNLTDVTFRNNTYSTGAIHLADNGWNVVGDLTNVLFEGNTSTGHSSGIYLGGSGGQVGNLTNVTFKDNTSAGFGVINVNSSNGYIGNLTNVNFENNTSSRMGGAIYNHGGHIGNWDGGSAIGNTDSTTILTNGGVLYNASGSTFGYIKDVAISNYNVKNHGGAIVNSEGGSAVIGDLINVSISNVTAGDQGGGIWNLGTIGNLINVTFDDVNVDNTNGSGLGGAIYNAGVIGNWIGGYAYGSTEKDYLIYSGGAIFNINTFGNIENVSFKNYSVANAGGAIVNDLGTIGNLINTSFINNDSMHCGGAISNEGNMGSIVDSYFENNTAYMGIGGAIENNGTLGDISGSTFKENKAQTFGGAIWTGSNIGNITNSYFEGNEVLAQNDNQFETTGQGGAIYAPLSLRTISGTTFKENKAGNSGGAIWVSGDVTSIENSVFYGNEARTAGGAIMHYGEDPGVIFSDINIKNSIFESNKTSLDGGGAIYTGGTLNMENSVLTNNSAGGDGGAILINGYANILSSTLSNNTSAKNGGAINILGWDDVSGAKVTNITNSNFISNTALGKGGAIYMNGDANLIADNDTMTFAGNTDSDGQNDIYVNRSEGSDIITLNLKAKNSGAIAINDGINGNENYNLALNGDTSGNIYFNADVRNSNINIADTNVWTSEAEYIATNNLNVGSGVLNIIHMSNANHNFGTFANTGTINIGSVDTDVVNASMGRITADTYSEQKGVINVASLNYLSEPYELKHLVKFADTAFSNNVNYLGENTHLTKLYKYDVEYLPQSGEFSFTRAAGGHGIGSFNPAAVAPLAANAGAKSAINETFQYVFEHADSFTQMPAASRFAKIHNSEYALSTDFNTNLGSFNYEEQNKGVWVRPFTTFENIPLKNGPKIDSITYGTLIGYDGDFIPMKNGWHRLGTGYVGYNGSQLRYSNVSTTMNGGLAGLTETFYKGNFWSAWTVSAGASVGETNTMYGHEDFTSLMAGVGTKTGYNFEFKEGKFIIQPIWNMSYTFVNTFDYTNAAGVKMNINPSHTIQLHPTLRFIANCKNGWQPYAQVGMVWNLMDKTSATANEVRLPEASVKPYIEYGVGVQRQWKDRFTAFFQSMIRNGGRNGIALTAGFRWALGKEGKPVNEQVYAPDGSVQKPVKTVLKQLTPAQRTALGAKSQNSTRTTATAILKSL